MATGIFLESLMESQGTKSKSPAGVKPAGRGTDFGLTLAILETFTSAGLTVLLALSHTWITRQISMRLERRAQIRIRFQQRARHAMPHCAGLPGRSAALHIHANIELR